MRPFPDGKNFDEMDYFGWMNQPVRVSSSTVLSAGRVARLTATMAMAGVIQADCSMSCRISAMS